MIVENIENLIKNETVFKCINFHETLSAITGEFVLNRAYCVSRFSINVYVYILDTYNDLVTASTQCLVLPRLSVAVAAIYA